MALQRTTQGAMSEIKIDQDEKVLTGTHSRSDPIKSDKHERPSKQRDQRQARAREGAGTEEQREENRETQAMSHCLVQQSTEKAKKAPSAPQNGDSRGRRWEETEKRVNEARDAEIDLPTSLPRFVSREIRERAMRTYPILRNHDGHRAFFLYIMNTPNRDDGEHWGTGRPVIPWKTVARCYGKKAQDYGGNLRIPRILEMYRDQVVRDFEESGYYSSGYARTVKDTGVDSTLEQMWREEQRMDRRDMELVDFFTGKRHTPKRRHHLRERRIAACEASEPRCSDGKKWREYLHDRDSGLYYRLLKHMPEAKAEARKLEGSGQVQAFVNLCRIEEQPMPFYRFSEKTVRLTTSRSGLQNLDSDLRDVLTQDWVKFDLSSAQLAIAAKDWGVETALAQLRSDESIWESLKDHTGVPIKSPLKKGCYSTVYGAERGTIKGNMAYEAAKKGRPMDEAAQERFLDHPVISELLEKRERVMEKIRREGREQDCYGNGISTEDIDDDAPERSVLSQLAQAQEMQLLTPALELAREVEKGYAKTPWQITLYLYDGFCVNFTTDTKDYHAPRIQEAVNQRCKNAGYPTRLEMEEGKT